jgi:hypothetical protein
MINGTMMMHIMIPTLSASVLGSSFLGKKINLPASNMNLIWFAVLFLLNNAPKTQIYDVIYEALSLLSRNYRVSIEM